MKMSRRDLFNNIAYINRVDGKNEMLHDKLLPGGLEYPSPPIEFIEHDAITQHGAIILFDFFIFRISRPIRARSPVRSWYWYCRN